MSHPAAASATPASIRTASAAIAFALLVVGCGSTVQGASESGRFPPVAEATRDELTMGSRPESFGTGITAEEGQPVGPSATRGPGAAAGSQPSSGSFGGETPGDAAVSTNGEPIKIGYVTTDLAGLSPRMGGALADVSNDENRRAEQREFRALVEYANETGGVGGRPIEAVEFPYSLADSTATYEEALCIAAADDHRVSAMIDRSYIYFDNGMQCFAKRGVTLVGGMAVLIDRQFLHSLRPYVASTWASLDRIVQVMVQGLDEADYFADATVGIILDDGASMRRVYQNHMAPALHALGVEPAEVVFVTHESTEPATAEIANAVLRFRTAQVTHVISMLDLFNFVAFQQQAESQGYRPRYGFGDYSFSSGVAIGFGLPQQNEHAVMVSSDPRTVLESESHPGWNGPTASRPADTPQTVTPGQRRCIEVLSKYTGDDYYADNSSGPQSSSFRWYCDHFFLWLEAARSGGTSPSGAAWAAGLAALGQSYQTALPYRTEYGPGRFDGASASRAGIYRSSCQCVIATSPWRPMGW